MSIFAFGILKFNSSSLAPMEVSAYPIIFQNEHAFLKNSDDDLVSDLFSDETENLCRDPSKSIIFNNLFSYLLCCEKSKLMYVTPKIEY
jgi:hypothetical protein